MSLNCTCDNVAPDPSHTDKELQDALREFKGFNLTVASLAVVILIVTSLVCSFSYHRRRRVLMRSPDDIIRRFIKELFSSDNIVKIGWLQDVKKKLDSLGRIYLFDSDATISKSNYEDIQMAVRQFNFESIMDSTISKPSVLVYLPFVSHDIPLVHTLPLRTFSRQCQRARFYENAIKSYERNNPTDVTGLKKMETTPEPQTFSTEKSNGDNSCPIYFIYDNPMALALDEGSDGEPRHLPEADQGVRAGVGTTDGCNSNNSKGTNTDPQVVFV